MSARLSAASRASRSHDHGHGHDHVEITEPETSIIATERSYNVFINEGPYRPLKNEGNLAHALDGIRDVEAIDRS